MAAGFGECGSARPSPPPWPVLDSTQSNNLTGECDCAPFKFVDVTASVVLLQDGWALIQRADLTTVWTPQEYVEVSRSLFFLSFLFGSYVFCFF